MILVVAIGVLAAAAWTDLRARHIANALPLTIGALGLVRLGAAGNPALALWSVAAATAVFAAAFLQWRFGQLGGGDVKLLAAAALVVGCHGLFAFLFLTSFFGLLVALAVFAASRLGGPPALLLPFPGAPATAARPSVPYGAAIAAAAAWVLIQQSSLLR